MTTGGPSTYAFADLWEAVWPEVSEHTALVCGPQRRTYAALAERINRLANHLRGAGVGAGDHVGIFLRNDVAYVEAMLAAFTLRAVPININYRYVADELAHLVDDSGSVALLFHRSLSGPVAGVLDRVGPMRSLLVLDDLVDEGGDQTPVPGEVRYDEALSAASSKPPIVEGRTGDDHYIMYTGGTTGLPKGVVWRQEDAFFNCMGGGDPSRLAGPISTPAEILDRVAPGLVYLPVAPMMHAAAQWTTFSFLFGGGKAVLMPGSLDPEAVWQAVQDEQANSLTLVGDAVGRPVIDCWEANPGRWDASSLFSISNGGAPMSPSLKARIGELFPDKVIADGFGSSEAGVQGSQRLEPGSKVSGLARFTAGEGTQVFDDDLVPVKPGSGDVGRVANAGRLPLGYLNDPEKTARTFVEVDGQRYCFTGDLGTVEEDGSIQLLGRGSQCINTGGEKVFPEEVEAALVAHPAVADVLVVGVPDERWGRSVTAVVAPADPGAPPTLDELRGYLDGQLARYKLPKQVVVVDEVVRSPAGKADYRWASKVAEASVTSGSVTP